MRFYPVSLDALLVELANLDETLALFDALQQAPIAGVQEIVPAARTLLVHFRPGFISREALAAQIAARDISASARQAGKLIEIPVHYNGEDLADVAQALGISTDEVIRRHTGRDYSVAFCGFAPGFAYLSGGAGFVVPRRSTPRTRIPAGAVALAGGFSGIYPQASPGGWQIIGVTGTRMWDLERDEPALLQPGYRVRFVDAGPSAEQRVSVATPSRSTTHTGTALEILTPGLQTLLQDLGRPGRAG
ncbi:TPA: carboxyltransferase domain-containing protein, partial [Pseudomonas putida]